MPRTNQDLEHAISICWSSEYTLRLEPTDVDAKSSWRRVAQWIRALRTASIPGIIDIGSGYSAITIHCDPLIKDFDAFQSQVVEYLIQTNTSDLPSKRQINIPVCYEMPHAPDLEKAADALAMSMDDVVSLHCEATYTVAFMGFSPGFGYLEGLPDTLALPRMDKPRISVPAGSVGIGGQHTGIYPQQMPGGWQLIGRTPLQLFKIDRNPPALLSIGDRVRFHAITLAEFNTLAGTT